MNPTQGSTASRSGRPFLLRWAASAIGVLAATQVVPGIGFDSWLGLMVATLLLGLLNAFVRPLLLLLSLPLVLLSLGLFLWVINAALLYFVGWLVKPFHVASFGSALAGAAVISIVSMLLGAVFGIHREPPRRGGPPPPDQPGRPVIDV